VDQDKFSLDDVPVPADLVSDIYISPLIYIIYRAGWAEKYNQERILAIWLSRTGFETILQRAAVVNRDFGRSIAMTYIITY